jgi:hypothetical protein
VSSENFNPGTLFGKMWADCGHQTEEEISAESFPLSPNTLISDASGIWTGVTSEWPSDEDAYSECSLAEILLADVPAKYWLSPRAAKGILRRAAKRGRMLPPALHRSLAELAATDQANNSSPPSATVVEDGGTNQTTAQALARKDEEFTKPTSSPPASTVAATAAGSVLNPANT